MMVDREFQAKTSHLVQQQVGSYGVGVLGEIVAINGNTIELIKNKSGGDGSKVINLIKSIEKLAEENSDDPYLIAMAERARAVQEDFENRQTSTAEALAELLREVESNETRKKVQAEKSFDGLTYFVYRRLLDAKIQNTEAVSRKIRKAFTEFPNWQRSENAIRELRKQVTFAIFAETDNLDQVTAMVDELFTLLEKANRI
jgi:type I restriction enzyme R subunit